MSQDQTRIAEHNRTQHVEFPRVTIAKAEDLIGQPIANAAELNAAYRDLDRIGGNMETTTGFENNLDYLRIQARKADVFRKYWDQRRAARKWGIPDPKKKAPKPHVARILANARTVKAEVDEQVNEKVKVENKRRADAAKRGTLFRGAGRVAANLIKKTGIKKLQEIADGIVNVPARTNEPIDILELKSAQIEVQVTKLAGSNQELSKEDLEGIVIQVIEMEDKPLADIPAIEQLAPIIGDEQLAEQLINIVEEENLNVEQPGILDIVRTKYLAPRGRRALGKNQIDRVNAVNAAMNSKDAEHVKKRRVARLKKQKQQELNEAKAKEEEIAKRRTFREQGRKKKEAELEEQKKEVKKKQAEAIGVGAGAIGDLSPEVPKPGRSERKQEAVQIIEQVTNETERAAALIARKKRLEAEGRYEKEKTRRNLHERVLEVNLATQLDVWADEIQQNIYPNGTYADNISEEEKRYRRPWLREQQGRMRLQTIRGGRYDYDEMAIIMREDFLLMTSVNDFNLEDPTQVWHAVNLIADDYGMTINELREFVWTLAEGGPLDGNNFDFDNLYNLQRNHNQRFALTDEPMVSRYYMQMYDLAEEALMQANPQFGREPLINPDTNELTTPRDINEELQINKRMRQMLLTERRRIKLRGNTEQIKVFRGFEYAVIRRQYLQMLERRRTEPHPDVLREISQLEDMMVFRGVLPNEFNGLTDEARRNELHDRRGRLLHHRNHQFQTTGGRFLDDNEARFLNGDLDQYNNDNPDLLDQRDQDANGMGTVLTYPRMLMIADRYIADYQQYQTLFRQDGLSTEQAPRRALIFRQLMNQYGLNRPEANQVAQIIMHEQVPEEGRLFNWNNLAHQNDNSVVLRILEEQAWQNIRDRQPENALENPNQIEIFGLVWQELQLQRQALGDTPIADAARQRWQAIETAFINRAIPVLNRGGNNGQQIIDAIRTEYRLREQELRNQELIRGRRVINQLNVEVGPDGRLIHEPGRLTAENRATFNQLYQLADLIRFREETMGNNDAERYRQVTANNAHNAFLVDEVVFEFSLNAQERQRLLWLVQNRDNVLRNLGNNNPAQVLGALAQMEVGPDNVQPSIDALLNAYVEFVEFQMLHDEGRKKERVANRSISNPLNGEEIVLQSKPRAREDEPIPAPEIGQILVLVRERLRGVQGGMLAGVRVVEILSSLDRVMEDRSNPEQLRQRNQVEAVLRGNAVRDALLTNNIPAVVNELWNNNIRTEQALREYFARDNSLLGGTIDNRTLTRIIIGLEEKANPSA